MGAGHDGGADPLQEGRAEVALCAVRKDCGDVPGDGLGELAGGPDVGAGTDADQKAEIATEMAGRINGVLIW